MSIELLDLTAESAQQVATWFEDDPFGASRFGGFYGDHPKWWNLVSTDESRHGWIAQDASGEVGFVDTEVRNGVGNQLIYVVAQRRSNGLGRELLAATAHGAPDIGCRSLLAPIEPDNTPSLRCHQAAGYTDTGTNEYGERLMTLFVG